MASAAKFLPKNPDRGRQDAVGGAHGRSREPQLSAKADRPVPVVVMPPRRFTGKQLSSARPRHSVSQVLGHRERRPHGDLRKTDGSPEDLAENWGANVDAAIGVAAEQGDVESLQNSGGFSARSSERRRRARPREVAGTVSESGCFGDGKGLFSGR